MMKRSIQWILGLCLAIFFQLTQAASVVPLVGSVAPDFALSDQSGEVHTVRQYRNQWLVLYFYPKDDTPGCTEQACKFRDDFAVIKALGAEVVGISVDSTGSHAEFAKKNKLPFPLLADKEGVVAASYGSLRNLLVTKLAKRNTFLIDPQGRIAKVYLAVEADKNSAAVIADLRQLARHPR